MWNRAFQPASEPTNLPLHGGALQVMGQLSRRDEWAPIVSAGSPDQTLAITLLSGWKA
jgi:hypothetical protein